jgi:hypothetical protein
MENKLVFFKYRNLRWMYLKIRRSFSTNKINLPKKMSESEQIAVSLFIKLMKDPESKLYYDIQSAECYIKSYDGTIYIFLEDRNMKTINTVVGYDIQLQPETEHYLNEKFRFELNKRRILFKKEALEKVDHSLHKTFDKIIENANQNPK